MELSNDSSKNRSIRHDILDWVKAILFAFVLAWLIRAFVFEHERVDGPSMNETLQTNQHLIVYKLGYFFHKPERGDIVTLQYQEGKYNKYLPIPDPAEIDYIKRVVGLPGETVDIKSNHIYINGKKLNEPYAKGDTLVGTVSFPLKVPKDEYLVLGDNRQNSRDGRTIGTIKTNRIRGKAVFSIWPFNTIGSIYKNFSKSLYSNINK